MEVQKENMRSRKNQSFHIWMMG